jgi:hypothetical protein
MSIVLVGSSSGSVTIQEPAVAGTTTYTLTDKSGTIAPIVSGTAVASTSGTSIDFTGIPSWAKRITVLFNGVSTSGASNPLIQLGDSGGIENTGYVYATGNSDGAGTTTSTAGFIFRSGTAANLIFGSLVITLFNGNIWMAAHNIAFANIAGWGAGSKTLSDVLDRVRITTVNGTDTFDAGSINILYE